MATIEDVNKIYQANFGRPAEKTGADYWVDQAAKNPGVDLTALIRSTAQTDDITARDDISAGKVDTNATWDAGTDVNQVGSKVKYDSASNKWVPQGIIATAQTPPKAALLGDPKRWEITADQTAQGQMARMADPNNPYYQAWATAGAQDAAARGFTGNSSIRETGILDSVMRNATPIATNDAATYAKSSAYNADMPNQFAIHNQDAQNAITTTGMNNATALAQSGISSQTQLSIARMNADNAAAVSAAHDANSVLIANNAQAKEAYNSYVAAIAQIDQNAAMDENAKRAAIVTQTQIFNSAINGVKAASPSTSAVSSPLSTDAVAKAVQEVGGVDVSGALQFGDYAFSG